MRKQRSAIRLKNLRSGEVDLEILVAHDYLVEQLQTYHFRINKRLDVWPSSKVWMDVKTRRKGKYDDLIDFVETYFMV